MMRTFLTKLNTLGTPATLSSLNVDLIFRRQRGNSTFEGMSSFVYGYVRRSDEDLQGYNRRNRTGYVMRVG